MTTSTRRRSRAIRSDSRYPSTHRYGNISLAILGQVGVDGKGESVLTSIASHQVYPLTPSVHALCAICARSA